MSCLFRSPRFICTLHAHISMLCSHIVTVHYLCIRTAHTAWLEVPSQGYRRRSVLERPLVLTAPQVSDVRERRYEASGLGSLYLFRVDDEIVVDATKRVSIWPSLAKRLHTASLHVC